MTRRAAQHIDAVHPGHAEVENQHVEAPLFEPMQRAVTVLGDRDV
jgi:hypothetical protein